MVGYWSIDKYSNDFFRDNSGNSNNGTAFHVSKIDGVKVSALRFYGEGSFAKITGKSEGNKPPSLISNLTEGSVSVWFKIEHIPLEHGIAPILYFGSTEKCDFFDAAIRDRNTIGLQNISGGLYFVHLIGYKNTIRRKFLVAK